MKTTINIDDDLLRRAKAVAAGRGITLTKLIEQGLRHAVATREEQPAGAFKVRAFRTGPALVDVNDRRALYEAMDAP